MDEAKSLYDIHVASVFLLHDELRQLGFEASVDDVETELYPHSIGHYLGLDLHDCPGFGIREPLKPGMAITIEPGLYIPPKAKYPARYHGLGIRLEDDLVVTRDGFENLTHDVPIEIEHVEQVINSR